MQTEHDKQIITAVNNYEQWGVTATHPLAIFNTREWALPLNHWDAPSCPRLLMPCQLFSHAFAALFRLQQQTFPWCHLLAQVLVHLEGLDVHMLSHGSWIHGV